MTLRYKKLADFVNFKKQKVDDAAYDLYACEDIDLKAFEPVAISVGISISCEPDEYFQIADRSGMGLKGIHVFGGVVDSSYRGAVKVILMLIRDPLSTWKEYHISRGDRIAQLIPIKINNSEMVEVTELTPTERGNNGFGSTGR